MAHNDFTRRGTYGDEDRFGQGEDDRSPQQGDYYTGGTRSMEQRSFGGGQQGDQGGGRDPGGQQGGYRGGDAGYRGSYGRSGGQGGHGGQRGYGQGERPGRGNSNWRGGGYENEFSGGGRSFDDRGPLGDWSQGQGDPSGSRGSYGGRQDRGFDDRDSHQPAWTDAHYGSDPRERLHHDPDYHQWRSEQLRNLDNDYQTWRSERYKKFSDEFNTWRSNRAQSQGQQGQGQGQTSSGSGSLTGSDDTGSGQTGSASSGGATGTSGKGAQKPR